MKKFNAKKVIAQMLAVGVVLTTLFPGTAYAAEVGEQVSETTDQISSVLSENSDLIEQAVIEAIQARGGDINDQALVDQVREEVRKKIENGDLKLDEQTKEETTETTKDSSEATTEDTNTSSESVSVTDHTSADEVLSDGDNSSKVAATRLIVTSDVELTEFYGAVTVDRYDNIYVLAYKSTEETDSAFNSFVANGIAVEKDASMDAIKEDEVPEKKVAEEVTDTEVTDVVEDTSAEAQPVAETIEEHKTIVAVIDTGISDVTNDETFKDRIIEGTSTISDSYVDDNGHGTAMAKIIAEDTVDENVMILPIKALDKDGKGTVLSVALAIKYAKEHGANVINLSLSGVGQSNILTNAINDCYNNGITVVTAAGNDNADAKEYIPGNVDAAVNIAAAEEDADGKIVSASYTNHGDNIDFAALGTYKLVVTKEKTTLETELRGTSIASAHVAAYVALLKQINATVDGVVNPISESDVMESLIASADNFNGSVNHTYFGSGYLSKDKLVFKGSDIEDPDKEIDKEETDEDGSQTVGTAAKKMIFIDQNHWWGFNDDNNWNAGSFDNNHPNGSPAQGLNAALVWFRGAGYNELDVCMMGNIQTYDTVITPVNMTLAIYGESVFSAGQKTWQRIGSGGDSPTIAGATSDNGKTFGLMYNDHTKIALYTVNIWDNTSTVVSFGDSPGAVGSPDIYAENCSFFSENHWWSVGTSNGTFNKCTFDNTWGHGNNPGAIASWKYLTCTNCTFSGKDRVSLSRAITYSGLLGAGLDCRGAMYIDSCTINNYGGWNTAIGCSGNVTIKNTTIKVNKNSGGEDVGVIYGGGQDSQTCTIDNVTVYNAGMEGIRCDTNDSQNGRAIVSVNKSNIYSNDTGIKVNSGTTSISNSNIYSNKYGITNNGNLSLTGGYVYNNSDTGVMCMGGKNILNSTIENNQITGVYVAPNQTATNYGTIRSNDNYGVFVSSGATYNHEAGSIHNNNQKRSLYKDGAGIRNLGTTNLKGGYVDSNYWANVWNQGTLSVTGTHLLNCKGGTGGTPGQPDYYYNSYQPAYGIVNDNYGTTTINGDIGISGNSTTGIWANSGTVNFHKGTVSDNTGKGFEVLKADNNTYATLNMYGGTVRNNAINLYNTGTSNISGGAITKSTQMNVDVYDGTVNFNGGSITESGNKGYGIEIQNNGSATFNQSANIGINTLGGVRVWANGVGRYNVYKGATTAVGSNGSDVGVYLAAGASMTIHDRLTSDVKVASYDRYTGKVIANCDNEAIANSAAQHLKLTGNKSFQKTTLNTRKYADTNADLLNAYGYNYEALWNHYNAYGRNEGRAAEDCGKTVVYRKGNGNTGKNTQIIVSQTEDTSFDTNLEANKLTDSRFSARIRTSDEFTGHKNAQWRDYVTTYWGEYNSPRAESIVYLDGKDVSKSIYNSGWATSRNGQKSYGRILTTYAGWYPTTLYAKYETGYDPNANHNDIDKPEKDDGTDDILDPNPQEPEKKPGENPNPQGYSYFFNGNKQDTGENYTVRHISSSYQMPDTSDFTRENYTGQGWSIISDATYKNTEEPTKMRKQGETADTLALLNACLKRNDCEVSIDNSGNVTITQYVVWDHIPTITAKDVTIAQHQVKTMDDNTIKSMLFGNCIAKDEEDGDKSNNNKIPNNVKDGEIGVTIIDFDRDEILSFKSTGSTTITFRATDGVGNTADKTVRLWVMSEDPIDGAYINRARCINKKFYDAGKGYEEGDLTGYKQGGLMPTDLWYTDEDYVKVIEEAFSNLESENWEFTWRFTHEQVLETQDYIEEHGFGDSIEKGALMNYYNKYKGNIGTNKLPNICDRTKHEVIPATCTEAAHCSICGETWGKPEHNYQKEIGSNVEVCTNCGATK